MLNLSCDRLVAKLKKLVGFFNIGCDYGRNSFFGQLALPKVLASTSPP
jgi:hypothetical protein